MSEPTTDVEVKAEATAETGPAPDSEEAILATVKDFNAVFGMKPEPVRNLYRDFGTYCKEKLDPTSTGLFYVTLGGMYKNIQDAEHKLNPSGYKRSTTSENVKIAARIAGVPESVNEPDCFAKAYWLAMLDRSTPGRDGESRTFDHSPIPGDWFGGNLSYGAMRVLFPTIKRMSEDTECDVWEFNPGWEAWVRDQLKKLRAGGLTVNQLRTLYDAKKAAIAKANKEEARKGKTPEQIKEENRLKKIADREKKLAELGEDAMSLAKNAVDANIIGTDQLTDFLVNKGVIKRPEAPPTKTVYDWAETITPGEAKALVQRIAELGRHDVLTVLIQHVMVAAQQNRKQETVPMPQKKSA